MGKSRMWRPAIANPRLRKVSTLGDNANDFCSNQLKSSMSSHIHFDWWIYKRPGVPLRIQPDYLMKQRKSTESRGKSVCWGEQIEVL